jgi:hypothetical protein
MLNSILARISLVLEKTCGDAAAFRAQRHLFRHRGNVVRLLLNLCCKTLIMDKDNIVVFGLRAATVSEVRSGVNQVHIHILKLYPY